jgi:PHS family inorganic phosphate transporter-like MFS transporter
MMAAVFAMQGFGILLAAAVAICTLAAFKSAVNANQDNLDYVWRICIGLGAVPCCLAIYTRLTIPETPRYTINIDNDIERAVTYVDRVTGKKDARVVTKKEGQNKASFKEFFSHFSKWKNLKVLLGTSVTWFALDVAFYGINLNSGIIIDAIGFAGDLTKDPWSALFNNSVGNMIIALLGTVPGYWFTVFLIDKWGRKTIQIIGFVALTALFLVIGFAYHQIQKTSMILFIVLFTLAQFFQNFGPNTTTFIIPGEVFPTKYRSTAHGFSAAMGKLGAIVSQVGFFQIKDIGGKNASIPHIIQIFSGFMFIGLLFTFLLPETKGKSLEELSGDMDMDEMNRDRDSFGADRDSSGFYSNGKKDATPSMITPYVTPF